MTSAAPVAQAKFLEGSIMRHVVIMTLTGALGLMAVFAVDLADFWFLSLLGNIDITAGIGFAGTLSFANLSLSIGTGIAAAALVARNLGAKKPERAKQFATSVLYITLAISALYTLLILLFLDPILRLMGAQGEALAQAKLFIYTLTPGFICLAGALSCSFSLRGLGDAKRAMFITLSAAIATLILDPIFIFYFGWGIQGAAAANAIADFVALLLGLHGLVYVHDFIGGFSIAGLQRDFKEVSAIAFPSILTQLATPFATAYMTYIVASFGNSVVTASAIVGRLVPVAFGVVFSLSGSVGPIIGQNYGAKNFERVRQALTDGMKFGFIYTLVTSAILFLLRHHIAGAFSADDRTTELVVFFATYVAVSWAFVGMLFVANAAFNNLGRASYSTWTNWGRATLGTIPFAIIGKAYWGAEGVMAATAIGSVIFGIAAALIAFRTVGHLEGKHTSLAPA